MVRTWLHVLPSTLLGIVGHICITLRDLVAGVHRCELLLLLHLLLLHHLIVCLSKRWLCAHTQ